MYNTLHVKNNVFAVTACAGPYQHGGNGQSESPKAAKAISGKNGSLQVRAGVKLSLEVLPVGAWMHTTHTKRRTKALKAAVLPPAAASQLSLPKMSEKFNGTGSNKLVQPRGASITTIRYF